jgi:hypothetical protein
VRFGPLKLAFCHLGLLTMKRMIRHTPDAVLLFQFRLLHGARPAAKILGALYVD